MTHILSTQNSMFGTAILFIILLVSFQQKSWSAPSGKQDFNSIIESQIKNERETYNKVNEVTNNGNSISQLQNQSGAESAHSFHSSQLRWNEYADVKHIPSEQVVVENSGLLEKDMGRKNNQVYKANKSLHQRKLHRVASELNVLGE